MVHQAGHRDHESSGNGQARRDADGPPGPDELAVPQGGADRCGRRRDPIEDGAEPFAQIPLVHGTHLRASGTVFICAPPARRS
jgi:hypothetical protein